MVEESFLRRNETGRGETQCKIIETGPRVRNDARMDIDSQHAKAAERIDRRRGERQQHIALLRRPGGLYHADTPERIAKRLDRLMRYAASERLPVHPSEEGVHGLDTMIETARRNLRTVETLSLEPSDRVLEKIINTNELLGVRYLDAGVAAARAVGRVQIFGAGGRLEGYGTGSLVSPRLLLTNNHVLPSSAVAAVSRIEFDFQEGIDGRPLVPRTFRLDPTQFWMTSEDLDFSLVAVAAIEGGGYGFNRLIEAEGKVIVGEAVTIVQHPGGETKQVALRENRVVDVLEQFLHYETDTQPGSSGSPVFNDQWEIVALHHASVRVPQHAELGGFANEGLRVSRLLKFVRAQPVSPTARPYRDQLLDPKPSPSPAARPRPRPETDPGASSGADGSLSVGAGDGTIAVTIPLEITVRVGVRGAQVDGVRVGATPPAADVDTATEAVSIDPDYANRRGYDPGFLGASARVGLPTLTPAMMADVAIDPAATGQNRHVLPYHHYSIIMNGARRLAFVTAVNIDGRRSYRIARDPDKWFFDPRIPRAAQAGNPLYAGNDLDRGHLVRRLDPAWGSDEDLAKVANDDTFHFTNCTPQHKDFNQNRTTWAGLEDYILDNADNRNLKVNVFTGPVLADDDDDYRGIRLPREFWKVVVMVKNDGRLSATAYLLSQESLLGDLHEAQRAKEAFRYGAYKTYQVPISRIEERTGLDFGSLKRVDPLDGTEAFSRPRAIDYVGDIRL